MIKRDLTIYLDMDGVMVNFIGGVEKLLNVDLSGFNQYSMGKYLNMSDSQIWKKIDAAGADFWYNLEKYPWTDDLLMYSFSLTDQVYIATSPSAHPSCAMGKHKCILKTMPKELHRRFFIGPKKQQFARDETTVLIDDSDSKVEAFIQAGGKAITFPQPWNSAKDYTDDRIGYIKDQLEPKKEKAHVLILEDDPARMLSFEKRFKELDTADITFDHVENVHSAINMIMANSYDMLFLDHDLGGETFVDIHNNNTGSAFARWLSMNRHNANFSGPIIIHSFNPQGAEYMLRTLNPVYKEVYKLPALWTKGTFESIFK